MLRTIKKSKRQKEKTREKTAWPWGWLKNNQGLLGSFYKGYGPIRYLSFAEGTKAVLEILKNFSSMAIKNSKSSGKERTYTKAFIQKMRNKAAGRPKRKRERIKW